MKRVETHFSLEDFGLRLKDVQLGGSFLVVNEEFEREVRLVFEYNMGDYPFPNMASLTIYLPESQLAALFERKRRELGVGE